MRLLLGLVVLLSAGCEREPSAQCESFCKTGGCLMDFTYFYEDDCVAACAADAEHFRGECADRFFDLVYCRDHSRCADMRDEDVEACYGDLSRFVDACELEAEYDPDELPGYFDCGVPGPQVPASQVCDGVPDCDNHADECVAPCDAGVFQCVDPDDGRRCVGEIFVCDGVELCADGSDEDGC